MKRLLFPTNPLSLVLLVFCVGAPAAAQVGGADYSTARGPVQTSRSGGRTFSISGQVLDDATNQPIENARVGVSQFTGGYMMESMANANGTFEFAELKRGTYYVSASHPDYEEKQEMVQVASGPVMGILLFLHSKPRATPPPLLVEPLDVSQHLVPKPARKEFEKGVEKYNHKNLTEAMLHFRKATELYPNYVSALHAQGVVHMRQGEYAEAQQMFEKAVEINPNVAAPRIFLGALYNAAHRFADAETQLARATHLSPQNGLAFFELSRAYWGLQNVDKAEEAVTRAHELSPMIAQVHLVRANVMMVRGRYDSVLTELDEFLALVPTGPIADHVRQQRAALQEQMARVVKP